MVSLPEALKNLFFSFFILPGLRKTEFRREAPKVKENFNLFYFSRKNSQFKTGCLDRKQKKRKTFIQTMKYRQM